MQLKKSLTTIDFDIALRYSFTAPQYRQHEDNALHSIMEQVYNLSNFGYGANVLKTATTFGYG